MIPDRVSDGVVLLIDDERLVAPDGTSPHMIARTYSAAIMFVLDDNLWRFQTVYLDHDLGETELHRNGYGWIYRVEAKYFEGRLRLPGKIVCVSDNPPGRARINQVIGKLYP